MPTKRELIVGLIGVLAGAAATVGGFKTDALKLCEGVDKGIVVGEKIGPMLPKLMAQDAGAPGLDAGIDAGK